MKGIKDNEGKRRSWVGVDGLENREMEKNKKKKKKENQELGQSLAGMQGCT